VTAREGSHFDKKNNYYDKLKAPKLQFFDIITPRDKLEENFGIYGPFKEGKEHPDQPSGIKLKHGSFYYIQRIQETRVLSIMLKHFIRHRAGIN
jgi:hypothetical protein